MRMPPRTMRSVLHDKKLTERLNVRQEPSLSSIEKGAVPLTGKKEAGGEVIGRREVQIH